MFSFDFEWENAFGETPGPELFPGVIIDLGCRRLLGSQKSV